MRPLVELHSHLEGTITADTLIELARGGREHLLPSIDRDELTALLTAQTVDGFKEYFRITRPFRVEAEDIASITRAELSRAHALGVVYGEYRFNPGGPARRGADPWQLITVIHAEMESAAAETGLQARLILGVGRAESPEEIATLLSMAREAWRQGIVCGVDLNGEEGSYPTRMFADRFAAFARSGCPVAIHAGEWDGPESVRAALDCGASRIAHGIRASEDDDLVEELAKRRIILETCPTSNVCTGVYDRIENVPLRRLFDRGVSVTVSSDDGAAFGSTIADEFAVAERVFGFNDGEIDRLLEHAVRGSFQSESDRESLARRVFDADP